MFSYHSRRHVESAVNPANELVLQLAVVPEAAKILSVQTTYLGELGMAGADQLVSPAERHQTLVDIDSQRRRTIFL